MDYTLREIAEKVNGKLDGDPELVIKGVLPLEKAGHGDLSVVFDARRASGIRESKASAFVVSTQLVELEGNVIWVSNPRLSLIRLLELFYPKIVREPLIHERAVVSPNACLGPGVSIGAGAFIGPDVIVGAGVEIYPNVYIGERSTIGEGSEIFANVTIYPETRIGKRVRIHGGTVIGSDGFGYVTMPSGTHEKIPQVGTVEIEDDVEIGANCTIDRGTMGSTRILMGTKIDNQVQIGHNCQIGRHCIIVGQTGISGSVRMGDHCVLAGQVGISDHVELRPGTIVGAQSGVVRDIGPGRWLGYPAIPSIQALRAYHLLTKLPDIRREVRDMKRRLAELESQNKPSQGFERTRSYE
jgi:UDP-3-O-[3-hydroxymyristoyl] glucosamine N-acyltransferase